MAAEDGTVLAVRDGAVLLLTLNRPERLNALARPLRVALQAALDRGLEDDDVRAIVVTGAGRAFCAGGDLDEITGGDERVREVLAGLDRLTRTLVGSPKPVVAAVNGPAAGAGLGLALACGLRVMSEDAFLTVAFGGIGLVPDTGVSWTLPRLVGPARALDLALTGRRVAAEEAERLGLADRRAPSEAVVTTAQALAAELAAGSRETVAATMRLLHDGARRPLPDALADESAEQSAAAGRPDFAEGVTAFRERRAPRFP